MFFSLFFQALETTQEYQLQTGAGHANPFNVYTIDGLCKFRRFSFVTGTPVQSQKWNRKRMRSFFLTGRRNVLGERWIFLLISDID